MQSSGKETMFQPKLVSHVRRVNSTTDSELTMHWQYFECLQLVLGSVEHITLNHIKAKIEHSKGESYKVVLYLLNLF
jgi:hypothetical protein